MPPPVRTSWKKLLTTTLTLGAENSIDLPLDFAIAAVILNFKLTVSLAGTPTIDEDGYGKLLTRIQHEMTDRVLFDGDGFLAKLLNDHEYRGGSQDDAEPSASGAAQVFNFAVVLPQVSPHKRIEHVSGLDPRGVSEHKLKLTVAAIADYISVGTPTAVTLTVTPVLEFMHGATGLDGVLPFRRQIKRQNDTNSTTRLIDLKEPGVLERILIVARTAAGARNDDLLAKVTLNINGEPKRFQELTGRMIASHTARSQGEVLPVGVCMLEFDPYDYLAQDHLEVPGKKTTFQLEITTANSDDVLDIVPHRYVRTRAVA